MQYRSAFLINSGLGAGNIGDDLSFQALRSSLPQDFHLHLGVFENYTLRREPYPAGCTIHLAPPGRTENSWVKDMPGLLIGTGLIFDRPGTGWPLGFLAPRLQHFHDRGLPVDAAGISAEPLTTPGGRRIFEEHFLAIRSWTVRDARSAAALIDMGVDPERIAVGSDWAWLFSPVPDLVAWAASVWQSLGIDLLRPLLIVSAQTLDVAALELLYRRDGFQIAFVCSDFRHPGFQRTAAERLQSLLTVPSVLVPNEFYTPAELVALLAPATAVLAQPYLFGVAAVLAGHIPVFLPHAQASRHFCEDLGLTPARDVVAAVHAAVTNAGEHARIRGEQSARARRNLDLFAYFQGLTL